MYSVLYINYQKANAVGYSNIKYKKIWKLSDPSRFFNDIDSFRVNNGGIYETTMSRSLNEIKIAYQFDYAVYKLDWDLLYR